jgi:hypothetical protein
LFCILVTLVNYTIMDNLLVFPISAIKECLFIQRTYAVIMDAKRIFAFCTNDKLPNFKQLGGHYQDFDGPLLIADLRLIFNNMQVCNGVGYAIKNIKSQIDDTDYVADPYATYQLMQKTHEKWCKRFSDLMDVMNAEDSDSDSADTSRPLIESINGTNTTHCDSIFINIPVEEQCAYINSQLASIDTFTFKESQSSEPINVSTEVAIGETLKVLSPDDLAIILAVQEGIDVPIESMERAFANLDRLQNVGAAKVAVNENINNTTTQTNTVTGHNATKSQNVYKDNMTTQCQEDNIQWDVKKTRPKNVDDAESGCYIM